MNHRSIPHALAAFALASTLAACGSKAPDNAQVSVPLALPAESAAAAAPDGSSPTASAAPSAAPSITIPAATDDIWKALDRQSADLQTAVQNGAWKDVAGKADAIRDLTAALPAHATKLSPDAQTKLDQDVTLVAAYAAKLSAAGNAGDAEGAKANFKKLNDVLGGITRFP